MYETKSFKELEQELQTSVKSGISNEEAALRLEKNGRNALTEKKKTPLWVTFFLQFNDPMIFVLLAAAIISLVLSEWPDAIIIVAVTLLNAVIGTIQESKAEKALDALKKLASPNCTVKRDGKMVEIKAEELVIGDLVVLEEGKIINADLRLTQTINLKIDESSLTGESVPSEKDATLTLTGEVGVGDRLNMAFMSTPVSYGRGEGIVIATGMQTEIGKIAGMLNNEKDEQTPLQKRLAGLSKSLGIICVAVCFVMLMIGFLYALNDVAWNFADLEWAHIGDLLIESVAVAVAAIPEGLPAVVTIVLAMGVQKMVKVNTIVRKLPSVETLGSVTVVCSDKTGTLTQNRMTIKQVYLNEKLSLSDKVAKEDVEFLATGLMLCCNASIKDQRYGDPTEIALLDYARLYQIEKEETEEKFEPRINEMPFDSVRKMMSTCHKRGTKNIIYTKGAMDSILKTTTQILIDGKIRPITEKDIELIKSTSSQMAEGALRVLALAYHEVEDHKKISEENLIFVGLVGMIDPPRLEAKPAIAMFKSAGIATCMITGDHKDTAYAIAKELGIVESKDQCISGDQLTSMSEDDLREIVKTVRVFARVSPENKVQIVKAFKANGNVVAMTGDGVNDAPSLKAADIGIAMGITGTDVAKGSADMILSDDNFASIEKAVEEGRGIYSNIKKSIIFLLSSNFGEVMVMFIAIVLGMPVPLIAIHILWVNLISDSLPALALGREDKEPDIMSKPPRRTNESIFAHGAMWITLLYGFVILIITMSGFLITPLMHMASEGIPFTWNEFIGLLNSNEEILSKARTFAFTTLGMSQLFHMLGMTNIKRTFLHVFKGKNWMLLVAFLFGFLLQVLVTEVPGVSDFFKVTQLHWYEWGWLLLLSSFPLILHELLVPVMRRLDVE